MICSDTSFLFSLYANDVHSSLAVRWLTKRAEPISITLFNEFELGNALRFAEYRELLPKGSAATYWAQFQAAIAQHRLQRPTCNLAAVLTEAERLSATYTSARGHHSFDILHLAAALHLGAKEFLTFDPKQIRLASREGLTAIEFSGKRKR